ncbi:TetR/AcrR family transcriptional regulator [Diaminobutyricibacter sp. McL0608]|uniref:TetR/AcrR family transcriptional regulator n=1 Tax=Leifsonia sp. McL0608 TaxID=3143537 RepID=UPI0031F3036C
MDSPDSVAPRRYANGVATREAILDAANELAIETGFAGVSLRELAVRTGISHPGLLRHFASTDEVLLALLDRHERANEAWVAEAGILGAGSTLALVELAEHNATVPGYVELFTTLAGEAASAAHPAHARFALRYESLRELSARQFRQSVDEGLVTAAIAPHDEAVRLAAAWDGLQLQSLYDPVVDVPELLRGHLVWLTGGSATAPAALARACAVLPAGPAALGEATASGEIATRGYAVGRARRDEIVDEAMKLFAASGFRGTSLQEIAQSVGISKATLLHHFGSKDNLLIAVLRRRDERAPLGVPAPTTAPLELVTGLADGARQNAGEPGLVELYSVLAAESANPEHPGHEFFRDRFQTGRAYFTAMFAALAADGRLPRGADPAFEAAWLLALWDGLQLQWLYDPAAVDVAEQLRGHLGRLVVA